jgi:ATP/maltotriose-dependent transcriptional regulator MalT
MEKALEYAKGAASYGEQVKFARDAVEGNVLLSLIYFAKGDEAETESRVQEAQRLSKELGTADTNGSPDPRIVSLSIKRGNAVYAARQSDPDGPTMDRPFSLHFFRDCLSKVDLLCNQGSAQKGIRLLEELSVLCVERQMMEAVLEIDLYRCVAYRMLGEDDKARRILEQALAFADSEWYVRLFIDHSAAVLPLLNDLARENSERRLSAHFSEVLSACRLDGNRRSVAKPPRRKGNSELTDRETEVLKLMAAGYRYKEIAVQISVSLETVRTHTRHILEKLNADSRGQAIRRARGLQLL